MDLARSPARVTVSCGGHPLPVLRRATGAVESLGRHGTLLGLVPNPELQDRSTDDLAVLALKLTGDPRS